MGLQLCYNQETAGIYSTCCYPTQINSLCVHVKLLCEMIDFRPPNFGICTCFHLSSNGIHITYCFYHVNWNSPEESSAKSKSSVLPVIKFWLNPVSTCTLFHLQSCECSRWSQWDYSCSKLTISTSACRTEGRKKPFMTHRLLPPDAYSNPQKCDVQFQ